MIENNEIEVTTTPPEDVEDIRNELDRFLAHTSTNNKSFVVRDRTGLRLSFAGLLPITTGENGEQRTWGASIILNSAELEYPQVDFKLRVSTKRRFNPNITCNRSKGIIKQNDVLVLTYQLPESSIEAVNMTLLIDSSPHEVPLCKYPKSDYYWIGKDTKVPGPAQLIKARKQNSIQMIDSTLKNVSPGRIENIPEGLHDFLFEGDGFQSMFKLLYPHCISLFRDLSVMKIDKLGIQKQVENGATVDVIAGEVVRRFHDANRQKFITTPALLQ